jgi:fibronectin-binding autotransporter adhesin
LQKDGAGTLILNGAVTATQAINVTAGVLEFTGTVNTSAAINVSGGLLIFDATKSGTGAVNVSAGELTGTGSINTTVTVSGTGGINLSDGTVAGTPLTVGNLAITGAAGANRLKFDLGTGAGGTDKIVVNGTTTVTNAGAAVIALNQIGGFATPINPGVYTLIDGTGAMDPVGDFALFTSKAFGQSYSLSVAGGTDLQLTTAAGTAGPASAFWKGGANNWSTVANWNTDATSNISTGAIPGYETNVTFYTTTPVAASLTSNLVDVDFDINSLNYSAAATSNTTIGGTKMLTIEARAVNGNTAGSGITLATPNSGTPLHTISAKVGIAADQTWTINSGARLQINGEITDFGAGRTLTKAGAGTLILNVAKPSTFPILSINAGTVDIGAQTSYPGTGDASQLILNGGTLKFGGSNNTFPGLFTLGPNGGTLEDAASATQPTTWSGPGSLAVTGSGARTLTLTGLANRLGNAVTFAPGIVDPTSGSTALTVASGSWALAGANTYSGPTTVSSGMLSFRTQQSANGGVAAFTPSNMTVEAGAALVVGIGAGPTFFDNAAIATILDSSHLGGSTATTGLKPGATFGIDTTGGGNSGVGGTFTYSNVISDLSGGTNNILNFIKTGTGTLILDQANTYTGSTTIVGPPNQQYSILRAGHSEAFGPATSASLQFLAKQNQERAIVALNGFDITVIGLNAPTGNDGGPAAEPSLPTSFGNFVINGSATNATLTVNNTVDSNYGGSLRNGGVGTLGLTKDGTGMLTLNPNNAFLNYSGQLTIKNGTLASNQINNISADGALGNSALSVIMGDTGTTGTFRYSGGTTSSTKPFTMATDGTGAFDVFTAGTSLTLSGLIDGNGGMAKTGLGTLILSSANTHKGTTLVSTGTLALANVDAVQDSTLDTGTSGAQQVTFTVAGTNTYNLGGLQGADNLAIGANSLSVGANDENTTYSGVLSGAGALTKVGSGILTLSGNNTYGGATNVDAGTLRINGNQSTATGAVTVDAGATLGGTGTVGGVTTISGTHSPGNSPGIQTFVSHLNYTAGADVDWELNGNSVTNSPNPNAIFDTVVVGGNLDFAGATALDLLFNDTGSAVDWNDAFWATSYLGTDGWLLYDVTGTTSNFANLSITVDNWLDSNGALFDSVRTGSNFALFQDGNDIYLNYNYVPIATNVVPEPSAMMAWILITALAVAWRVWKRRT